MHYPFTYNIAANGHPLAELEGYADIDGSGADWSLKGIHLEKLGHSFDGLGRLVTDHVKIDPGHHLYALIFNHLMNSEREDIGWAWDEARHEDRSAARTEARASI
jgi:hypothetical protein